MPSPTRLFPGPRRQLRPQRGLPTRGSHRLLEPAANPRDDGDPARCRHRRSRTSSLRAHRGGPFPCSSQHPRSTSRSAEAPCSRWAWGGAAMALLDPRRARLGATRRSRRRSRRPSRSGSPPRWEGLGARARRSTTLPGKGIALRSSHPLGALSVAAMLALIAVERRPRSAGGSSTEGSRAARACPRRPGRRGRTLPATRSTCSARRSMLLQGRCARARISTAGCSASPVMAVTTTGTSWQAYDQHPWLGIGAGSYEREWLRRRPTRVAMRGMLTTSTSRRSSSWARWG